MRRNKVLLTVIFIVTVLALLWSITLMYVANTFSPSNMKIVARIIDIIIVLFVIGATWLLYKKEWRSVLGLTTKGVTKRVILKSTAIGLLISVICNIILYVSYWLLLKEKPEPLLGGNYNIIKLLIGTLILAPIFEEFLFRGFIQGLWQKLCGNKEKTPTKLIITVTALLFAVSHFGFLLNISLKEFFFSAFGVFILAIYLSWLRYKYNSIIPSMFAHVGANLSMIVTRLILAIILIYPNNKFDELRLKAEIAKYENDTLSYNFDPNNMCEWERSYNKYAALERPRSEEVLKHLKGISTGANVSFTIDTCGNVYNVYVKDTAFLIKNFKYSFAKESLQFVKSMPQCKPYIVDGKKVEKEMTVSVPLH